MWVRRQVEARRGFIHCVDSEITCLIRLVAIRRKEWAARIIVEAANEMPTPNRIPRRLPFASRLRGASNRDEYRCRRAAVAAMLLATLAAGTAGCESQNGTSRLLAQALVRPYRAFTDGTGTNMRAPLMVTISPGAYTTGSTSAFSSNPLPFQDVAIGRFAIGVHEVTRGSFRQFLSSTGYEMDTPCHGLVAPSRGVEMSIYRVRQSERFDWSRPGFRQHDRHPVVCVSWVDAQAYTVWLSAMTGRTYRLPSESEYGYAARAVFGDSRNAGAFWLGDNYWGESGSCFHANLHSRFFRRICRDGYRMTAPVATFAGNRFGPYDMLGNVWELTADCWNSDNAGPPTDGSARRSGYCDARVLRGGSFATPPPEARFSTRERWPVDLGRADVGFRVARDCPCENS